MENILLGYGRYRVLLRDAATQSNVRMLDMEIWPSGNVSVAGVSVLMTDGSFLSRLGSTETSTPTATKETGGKT